MGASSSKQHVYEPAITRLKRDRTAKKTKKQVLIAKRKMLEKTLQLVKKSQNSTFAQISALQQNISAVNTQIQTQ